MDEFNKALRVAAKMKPDTFSFIEYEDDTPDDNNSTFMRRLPVGTDGARGWQEFRYPFEMSGDDIDTLAGLFGYFVWVEPRIYLSKLVWRGYYRKHQATYFENDEIRSRDSMGLVSTKLDADRESFTRIIKHLYPDEFK